MRVLSVEEAAVVLDVSPRTVYDCLRRGQIPGRKIGRAWRIPEWALIQSLAAPALAREGVRS